MTINYEDFQNRCETMMAMYSNPYEAPLHELRSLLDDACQVDTSRLSSKLLYMHNLVMKVLASRIEAKIMSEED